LIWLGVDEFAVVLRPETIRSVLGSCVGIGLFHVRGDWFAFNHFLDVESGGLVSEKMLAAIQAKGCRDFRAIIAGGARQPGSAVDIGERNRVFAREFLARRGIPILREDVGGCSGRTVTVSLTDLGPELITDYHAERPGEPPAEDDDTIGMSEVMKSSREAYEFQVAIAKRNASRGR
jgi:chemotaxis receptor (MCP) glutamine deamidase CheD